MSCEMSFQHSKQSILCRPCVFAVSPRRYYVALFVLLSLFVNQCFCHQATGVGREKSVKISDTLRQHVVTKRDIPHHKHAPDSRSEKITRRAKRQSPVQMYPSQMANQFPSANQLLTNQMPAENQFASNIPAANQFAASNPRELNSEDEIRHKLLMTLENRLQERNMLLHDNEMLREKEFLREKEMNSFMSNHPSLFSNAENPLLAGFKESQKSMVENNGLFSRPHGSLMSSLDGGLLNGHVGSSLEGNLLGGATHMADGVGSLGDETIPFGSLGLSKSDYIPVGRVDDNSQVR